MSDSEQRVYDLILQRLDSLDKKLDEFIKSDRDRSEKVIELKGRIDNIEKGFEKQCGSCQVVHDKLEKRQSEIEEVIKNIPSKNRASLQIWVAIIAGTLSSAAIVISLIRG